MKWAAIVLIGLLGSMGLAGSEKWYPAQTILEPTLLPEFWGISQDIHGDLIYLGMISDRSGPKQQMGQIYRRHGNQWNLEQELSIEVRQPFASVLGRIQDDMCIVLGRYYDPEDWSIVGKVYAFQYDGTEWNLIQELVPPEGGLDFSLDMDANICVIGGNGCTHVFRYDGQQWKYEQKLPAGANTFFKGVAVSGNRIVTTSVHEKSEDGRTGAAYFFVYDGSQWQPDGKVGGLFDYAGCDFQGIRTDLDQDWCILGLPDPCAKSPPGRVRIYRRTDQWRVYQELPAFYLEETSFGEAVFVHDGVCGISHWEPQTQNDTVILYTFNGSIWLPAGKADFPMPRYDHVWNVGAYDGGYLLIEAGTILPSPQTPPDGVAAAAVYRACPAADLTGDCRVDLLDFAQLAQEWMK